MAVDSINTLVNAIGRCQLLEAVQYQELHTLQDRFPDAEDLARELMDRGWLTAYQVDKLSQGLEQDLVLGSYVLIDRLSDGPMGPVYLARHQHMKRSVVLQVIRAEWLPHPEAVAQFYREIQAISQLTHPHLVHAYDVGLIGQTHYCVMEYVDGIDLERLVQQFGPLPIERACEFIRQAALGLQHAFERGLRHYDLHPASLLVTRKMGRAGQAATDFDETQAHSASFCGSLVKIRNLGLTFFQPQGKEGGCSGLQLPQAEEGGSAPCYLAPEQELGQRKVDIRSNLYSLGCIFYYALTARAPFLGRAGDRESKTWLPPPDLEQVRPEVPPEVAAAVRRLMAPRPEDRFQKPFEVAAALAQALDLGTSGAVEGLDQTDPNCPLSAGPATAPPGPHSTIRIQAAQVVAAASAFQSESDSEPAEDLVARHRQRSEAHKRRLFWWTILGSAVLVVGVAFLAILIAIQMGGPARKPAQKHQEAPLEIKSWHYVRKPSRDETILATLEANHLPTLQGKWSYIGPFDNPEPDFKGFDTSYPPESEVDLAKTYPGKAGLTAAWKAFPDFAPGKIIDLRRFPNQDLWSCVYLYHEIEVEQALSLPVWFGSDDTLTVWLNGERLISKKTTRAAAPNQDYATLELKPGRNRLLIKVCQGTGDWAIYVMPQFPTEVDNAVGYRLRKDF